MFNRAFHKRQKMSVNILLEKYDPSFESISKLLNFQSHSPRNIRNHIDCINKLLLSHKLERLKKCREKLMFYQNLIKSEKPVYIHSTIKKDIEEECKEWHKYSILRSKTKLLVKIEEKKCYDSPNGRRKNNSRS